MPKYNQGNVLCIRYNSYDSDYYINYIQNVHITDKYYEGKCIYQNIGHKDPYFSNTFDTVDYAYEVKVLGTSIDEAINNYPEYFL